MRVLDIVKHEAGERFFEGRVNRSLRFLDLNEIRACPYNAEKREQKFDGIESAIKEIGGVLNPIHVWWNGSYHYRIDGAGRCGASKRLGYSTIQAFVYEGDEECCPSLYAILNGTPRPVTGQQQIETIVNRGPVFPGRRKASQSVKIMNEHGTPEHIQKTQAPAKVECAERLTNAFVQFKEWKEKRKWKDLHDLFNNILEWMHSTKSYGSVHDALTRELTKARRKSILTCLVLNKHYTFK